MDAGTRDLVRQRAANCCEYCRLPAEADEWPFHVEHIIARQHGGGDDLANLCWACSRCNLHKGPNLASIDPETAGETSLFRPRLHSWRDHFELQGGQVVGRTSVGRATVRLLDMNDGRRVELRRKLVELGMHPT
jgi:HNH endonuclease